MTFKFGKTERLVVALLAGSIGLLGCGGSSNGNPLPEPGPSDAAITVSPANFDFGVVTDGNREGLRPGIFTLSNAGEISYNISNITLEGDGSTAFELDESGGNAPCNQRVFTLGPGESCTVAVSFVPQNFETFTAALSVFNNEPPGLVTSRITGTFADIEKINVTVNQINACPRSPALAFGPALAFVSVTDQGGFPIRGLTTTDFTIEELGIGGESNPADARSVVDSDSNLALSIVMDYSGSITNDPATVSNMEEAAAVLVDAMRATDTADIIKYADEVRCMLEEGFDCSLAAGITPDQARLRAAIEEDPDLERFTAFYDATLVAIERLKSQDTDRRVVISLTDGEDTSSKADADDTVAGAIDTDIPVFTVGFGNVDVGELQMIAGETGGLFYNPAASDNLNQVYQQLANLLFRDQYVITFDSAVPEGDSASLVVKAAFKGFAGEGSKVIQTCP